MVSGSFFAVSPGEAGRIMPPPSDQKLIEQSVLIVEGIFHLDPWRDEFGIMGYGTIEVTKVFKGQVFKGHREVKISFSLLADKKPGMLPPTGHGFQDGQKGLWLLKRSEVGSPNILIPVIDGFHGRLSFRSGPEAEGIKKLLISNAPNFGATFPASAPAAEERELKAVLEKIRMRIVQYSTQHQGAFPPSLETLLAGLPIDPITRTPHYWRYQPDTGQVFLDVDGMDSHGMPYRKY